MEEPCGLHDDPRCLSRDADDYGSSTGDRCNETAGYQGPSCTASYVDQTSPAPPTGNCHDEASCSAVETCHVELRNTVGAAGHDNIAICDFPSMSTGCCDYFTAVLFCASAAITEWWNHTSIEIHTSAGQHDLLAARRECILSTMSSFGNGELQWMQAHQIRENALTFCPDIGEYERDRPLSINHHCHVLSVDGSNLAHTTTTSTTPAPPSGNCHDDATCSANETCHVAIAGAGTCAFPNVCVGACDFFSLATYCNTLNHGETVQACVDRVSSTSFSPGEYQWIGETNGPVVDWCPGSSVLGNVLEYYSYCQLSGGTLSNLQLEEFAIMAAQKPRPKFLGNQSPRFAVGALALVATFLTIIIATKKKGKPGDHYTPLTEEGA